MTTVAHPRRPAPTHPPAHGPAAAAAGRPAAPRPIPSSALAGRPGACALGTLALAAAAAATLAPPARSQPAPAPAAGSAPAGHAAAHLQCALPGGATVGLIHQQGQPLAVTLGVTAGARECASRSTAPAQPVAGGWRFEWHDDVLNTRYAASVHPLPGGAFRVRLAQVGAPASTLVGCGALALPADAPLAPDDARCETREDRSEALQAAWQTLREALLQRDAAHLQRVLAPRVMLQEGAESDSPRVAGAVLAGHLACIAGLTQRGQRFDDWARARPHLPIAPTGLVQPDDATSQLGGYAVLQWQGDGWQLTWLAASRAVLLRPCAWPPSPR